MIKGTILIIDDEAKLRSALSRIIELEGYHVFQADTAQKAFVTLEQQKDISIIISDVRLPDANGIQLLEKIKGKYPFCEVILLTAYGTIHDGVKAMKLGAFDYVTKGDGDDQILVILEKANEKARMQRRILDLEKKLKTRYSFEQIVGKSNVLSDAIRLAKKVAPEDSTVLIEGETGTGKELFAQSIHNASPRRSKSFIAVNCSAFPKELLESEVFGYRKGAFTGANSDKKGLFEEAHEGTLFLDEIGDMDIELQGKFLRVLEDQSFTRIGDTKPINVDVRIIAATNRDLMAESASGRFRTDLYYRLSGFRIVIPPLRDRIEDLDELVSHFISFYSKKTNKKITGMNDEFFKKLKGYKWPGNTRELKNMIERAVILADREQLTADLLPYEIVKPAGDTAINSFEGTMEELEKMHIRKILAMTRGNKTKAAEILGIGIPTLYRKMEKFGIE